MEAPQLEHGHPLATDDNRGPIINVSAWILIVIASLATIVKLVSKGMLMRKLQLDDLWIGLSWVAAVAYVIALMFQVDAGLGRHRSTMSAAQDDQFGKSAYVSELFYVISIGMSKMALLQFLLTLAKAKRSLLTKMVIIFNSAIIVIFFLPVAFQCSVPRTWDILNGQCFNRVAFWVSFGVVDIVVDMATILLPIYLLYDLQVKQSQRLSVIIAFMTRALMVPIVILRIVYIEQSYTSDDFPFEDYAASMATSVHICLSILTTCIPFLRPVMESLQSGILAADITSGLDAANSSYKLDEISKGSQNRQSQVPGRKPSRPASKAFGNSFSKRASRQLDLHTSVSPMSIGVERKRPMSGDSDEFLILQEISTPTRPTHPMGGLDGGIHKETTVTVQFEQRSTASSSEAKDAPPHAM